MQVFAKIQPGSTLVSAHGWQITSMPSLFGQLVTRSRRYIRLARERAELVGLDATTKHDIGNARILTEMSKPFWRA